MKSFLHAVMLSYEFFCFFLIFLKIISSVMFYLLLAKC